MHLLIYLLESNIYLTQIESALSQHKPCNGTKCICNVEVIDRDLEPYKSGITEDMIRSVRDRGTKYQIVANKLYRQSQCMFPSRCSGIEYFIKKNLKKLPDMEMIINCRDWPQIQKISTLNGPVLSFSKTNDYQDIMYPTWSFWEGGPAISLYPTGLGRWDQHRKLIANAAEKKQWVDKIERAFFRGSRTSHERDSLILLSRKQPELVDAQYTKNQAWKSPIDTLNAEPAKEVALEDHCVYKYLFNFRGVAASFRLKHLFLCKSLVFHVGDEWQEFFYTSLKPWVHYVPVKSNPSIEDIADLLDFFKHHDNLAQQIAERGFHHIWDNLSMSHVSCYWRQLLKRYAKLLTYEVKLDLTLVEI